MLARHSERLGRLTGHPAPAWFADAMADAPSSHRVDVEGCSIHFLRWGPTEGTLPGILFLHGGGAHARWWSFIAPFFDNDRPVAALDFSGMGDSGRRTEYGSHVHVPEISAVIEAAGLGDGAIIVGHSFGAYMSLCHAARHGAQLGGAVIIDAAIRPGTEDRDQPRAAYDRPKRHYPDKLDILSRFRLAPEQPCENHYLLDHVAEHSVIREAEGWTWKFDVAARGAAHFQEPLGAYLRDMPCHKALIYGSESAFMTPGVVAYMKTLLGPNSPVIAVPTAHHHLTVEQPIAFNVALQGILAGWGS